MKKILLATVMGAALLSGCATQVPGSYTYESQEAGVAQSISYGTVLSTRAVVLEKGKTGVGAGVGAVAGGVLAAATIGSGWGSAAAGIGGALLGGLAGDAVEGHTNKTNGVEITVRLAPAYKGDKGRVIAVTQAADEMFYAGDRVKIINSGSRVRVTHL